MMILIIKLIKIKNLLLLTNKNMWFLWRTTLSVTTLQALQGLLHSSPMTARLAMVLPALADHQMLEQLKLVMATS